MATKTIRRTAIYIETHAIATSITCPTPDKTTVEETSEAEIVDVDPSHEVDHDHPNHHELQDSLVDHDLTHPHHMKGATAVGKNTSPSNALTRQTKRKN